MTDQNPLETPSAAATPPRRKPLRWRLFKLSVRVGVVCLLLLLVVVGMLLIFPWSIPALDQKVQRQWRQVTGLDLFYGKAVFRLLDGTITIEQPTLRTRDDRHSLISLREIVIDISFAQFLFNKPPFVIDGINVDGDLALSLITEADGAIHFDEPWNTIFGTIGRHVERSTPGDADQPGDPLKPMLRPAPELSYSQPLMVLNRVTVARSNVRWMQWLEDDTTTSSAVDTAAAFTASATTTATAALPVRPRAHRDWLELDDVVVECDFAGSLRLNRMLMQGRFNRRPDPESFRLSVVPLSGEDIRYVLQLSDYDTLADLPIELPLDVRGRDLKLEGTLHESSARRWRLRGQVAASDLELIDRDDLEAQRHGQARVDWDLDLDLFDARLGLNRLSVRSELLDARTSGTLGLRDPFPYTLELSHLGLHSDGMRLLANYLVPSRTGTVTHRRDAGIELVGRMIGNITDGRPGSLTARLAVDGVDWDLPQLPIPLRQLQGSARLTSSSLVLEELSGQVLDLPVQLTGVIHGNPLAGEVRDVDLTWRAGGSIQGVNALLELFQIRGAAIPAVSGRVDGEGFVRLTNPLTGTLDDIMQRLYIEGWLDLRDAEMRHSFFPVPLTNINGRVDLAGNQAVLKSLQAECFGLSLKVNGSMRGHEQLWEEPSFDLKAGLTTDLDVFLRNLDLYLSQQQVGNLTALMPFMPITGQVGLNLDLELPSTHLAEAQYRLQLGLRDFSVNPRTELIHGQLTLPEFHATLTPDVLRIEPAAGRWGAHDIHLEAQLVEGAGHVQFDLAGAIDKLQEQVPAMLPYLVFGGRGEASHTQTIALAPGAQPIGNWLAWIRELPWGSAQLADWRRVAENQWTTSMLGEIELIDAEVTWYRMPTRINHINGRLLYDDQRLWSPEPGNMQPGKHTRGTKGTIEVIYGGVGRNEPVVLNFHAFGGTLGLASWLGPYRPHSYLNEDRRDAETQERSRRRAEQGPPPIPTPQPVNPANPPRTTPPVFRPPGEPNFMVRGFLEPDSVEYLGIKTGPGSGYLDITVHRPDQKTIIHFRDMKADLYGGEFTFDSYWHDFWLYGKATTRNVRLTEISQALGNKGIGGGGVITGDLSAELDFANDFDQDPYGLYGNGRFTVTESDLISSTLFDRLARLINFSLGQKTHFSRIDGQFDIERNVAAFRDPGIVFDAPIMNLVAAGKFGPGTLLDLQLRLQFLKIAENVPGLSQILSGINYVTGSMLRYRVRGTLENPDVSAL